MIRKNANGQIVNIHEVEQLITDRSIITRELDKAGQALQKANDYYKEVEKDLTDYDSYVAQSGETTEQQVVQAVEGIV